MTFATNLNNIVKKIKAGTYNKNIPVEELKQIYNYYREEYLSNEEDLTFAQADVITRNLKIFNDYILKITT